MSRKPHSGRAVPKTNDRRSDSGKARKRIVTPARREQNRLNQRAYRQRLRATQSPHGLQRESQRLSAQASEICWPSRSSCQVNGTTITREANFTSENSTISSLIRLEQDNQEKTNNSRPDEADMSNDLLLSSSDWSWTAHSDFQSLFENEISHDLLPTWPLTVGNSISCTVFEKEYERTGTYNHNAPSSHTGGTVISGESSAAAKGFIFCPDLATSPTDLPLEPNIPSESSSNDSNGIGQRNRQKDEFTVQGFDLGRVISAGIESLRHGSTSQVLPPSSRLPDPWMECIQFSRTHIIFACIRNAQSMGFKVEDIMVEKLAPSPFYQPLLSPTDDPNTILATITSPTTPAHLKPTLPQILYPHPAFMDIIPIPAFRAHAITLLATQPHMIDIHELKKDVAVENGICYWSSLGSNRGKSLAAGDAQGQPWDMRSWEVAPWFMCKWRALFGGEEGETWKQSQWWQRARGEVVVSHSS
ncbi:conserved hypothetical protein [Talaromyces stipitatus ATCC 10500]|uniref:BZIP domain-containing protein n=1 Tax=Talaromyces stipitatus (strain ATCC 10500 / CBS 375.48 / QM 6759 / NRRL 1006) TaxID=441959 RepID=B8M224_TALSN|nr:uncharacterized protein TSTA_087230 [Talaromyces stipitatus ATCC 10500]EED21488.1 conserved hypothetical protein [Talaromyces stipitatus ATCC 10500]